MENPKRFNVGPRFIRETSIGPVDKWLGNRAEWMIETAGIQKYLSPKIKYEDRLAGKVERGVRVLSIGAGKGHEIDEMDKILPGSEIIGLDPHDFYTRPVEKRLETLAHKASYLPETVGAEKLEGIEDESLDGVTLFFVLHHIDDKNHDAVLKEIKRVLKPDGKVFVSEDLVDGEEERKIVENVDRKLNLEFSHDNPHCYRNIQQWQEFFRKQGFNVVEVNEQKPEKVRHGFFVLEKIKIEEGKL